MNDTHTQILCVDFLRVPQSYAYDTKIHVLTSSSDAHANYALRISTRAPIIHKRLTLEVYAYDKPTLSIPHCTIVVRVGFISA